MKKEKTLKTIGALFIIGLVLAACSGAAAPAAPTATIAVKAPTTISQPTASPTPLQPTPTPTPALPAMKEYKHPSNSFSISVPADWTVTENSGYVFLSSPDQKAFVEIFAENTANALNADTFTNTINAFEFNALSYLKNYKEVSRDVLADQGYAVIAKSLDINMVPFVAATVYEQKGKVLYIKNYYNASSAVDQYAPIFDAIGKSFISNSAYAEDLGPFTSAIFDFIDPDNLYSLVIPSLWTWEDANKDGTVISYTSPDSNAFIMLYKKDLGKKVIRILADSTALEFLKSMSMSTTKDTRVSVMNILENGSIKMDWSSKSSAIQGTSIYKWSGTTWFILSWMTKAGFEDLYGPVFNQSIASYKIPE